MNGNAREATDPRPAVSIIVPLYNEQDNVLPLHAAILAAMESTGITYEIVLVDDGSEDDTPELAGALASRDPHVCLVRFRQNCGQTAAMSAGMQEARAAVFVTMDGDLQNDPKDIPLLLGKIFDGYDIVAGFRINRQDALVSRLIPSRIANWLIGRVTGVRIRDNGCSLKAYRASVLRQVPLYSDMHRFIPALASTTGARITEVGVRHHPRLRGTSKYGLSRIYKVLLDIAAIKTIVAFSARPLYLFAGLGLVVAVPGVAALAYGTVSTAVLGQPLSLPIMGSAILLISAASTLLLLGILGAAAYRLSEVRESRLAALTLRVIRRQTPVKASR